MTPPVPARVDVLVAGSGAAGLIAALAAATEGADVLLENLGPAEQRRHGLSPEEVRARHPHLVHVAIADFGLSGPRASWRAEPLVAFAALIVVIAIQPGGVLGFARAEMRA